MPEIDADLFQILTLVLLAVTLAVALAALSAVDKLRKELHSRTAHASLASDTTAAPAAAITPHDNAEQSVAQVHDANEEAQPEPQGALRTEESYQGSAASAAAQLAQDPDLGAGDPYEVQDASDVTTVGSQDSDPTLEDASAGFDSAESQAAWGLGSDGDSTETTPAEDVATTQAQEQQHGQAEQDDQPFEHEGRWYFRRGVELLVYEESTGQWVTAPDDVALASAPTLSSATSPDTAQTSGQTFGDISEAGEVSTEAAPTEEAGQFWKCASCGAVNGSTADSCRMCFAPKP